MPTRRNIVPYRLLKAAITVSILLAVGSAGVGLAQDLSEPSAVGEAVAAGPWSMTVQQVLLGDEAGADERNGPAPDGYQYVAAEIAVMNQASQPFVIDAVDFAIADSTGYLRRAAGIFPTDPALEGMVAPGESLTGWILGIAAAGDELLLIYDSATISGDWADHAFALTDGASLEPSQERAAELNRDGRTPDSAVGLDTLISTPDWTVRLVDIVSGPAVYDISPDGTRRLADSYRANGYDLCLDNWIAFNIEVTNNGGDGQTRYLSPTALQLAYQDGSPVEDVRTLSPPAPDVSGAYLAGATRTGWVSVELPNFCEAEAANLIYDGTLLRFQPSVSTDDVRYLTWGEGGGSASAPDAEPFDPDTVVPAGTIAVTTDAGVRMRQEPSTEGEIVVELNVNVEVEITGEPQEGDGYVWYPVRVVDSGDEGWIVQDFLGTVE
jgi:hypothetical protein